MKSYIFNWHKNEKYGTEYDRNTLIQSNNPRNATSIFMKNYGNLKVNTINYIQEIDPETGDKINEPYRYKEDNNK